MNTATNTSSVGQTYFNTGRSIYTSNGTFTVPPGVTEIRVMLVGGGGASRGSSASGSSGSCAGIVIGELTVTPNESITVVVGAGGVNYDKTSPEGGKASYIARGSTILAAAGGGSSSNTTSAINAVTAGGYALFISGIPTLNELDGTNGSSNAGGNGGKNYIAYLKNALALKGYDRFATIGSTGAPDGITSRLFSDFYTAGAANYYGNAGNGSNGRPGAVIIYW